MILGSEALVEMYFYILVLKVLCIVENVMYILYNFYILCGVKICDISKWIEYLNEMLDMWGNDVEVLFMLYIWLVWGNKYINDYIGKYCDIIKYIYDQILYLVNQGYIMNEIGDMIKLLFVFVNNWVSCGYYGFVSYNVCVVYNFYFGYYDGNLVNLYLYGQVEMGKCYVQVLGGFVCVINLV